MGQKVHPTGIRLGIVKDWSSKWYADSQTFPEYVKTDHDLRVFIKKKLKDGENTAIIYLPFAFVLSGKMTRLSDVKATKTLPTW